MMDYNKVLFFFLFLLSIYTLAQELNDNGKGTCPLSARFKTFKNYLYQYTTESRNAMGGTINGVQMSCQVEIEVPQPCNFIMKTRDCSLSEISSATPGRKPVFVKSSSSDDFFIAMNRTLLKFTVDDVSNTQLFPEADEPVKILNIKRGIISALMMPVKNEKRSLVHTIHGHCLTNYLVNARTDMATYVTMSRNVSQCDSFYSRELTSSPLALLQRLSTSKQMRNTQTCNYQFDNKGKHLVVALCTEEHIYMPFIHKDDRISSVVFQNLTFQSAKKTSPRVFDVKHMQSKALHYEEVEDDAHVQTQDTVLPTLQKLMALAGTAQNQERSSLFHELVYSLRVLRNNTLVPIVSQMMQASAWLTWQALLQCGTPGCTSVMLQTIRTLSGLSLEVDALVYGLGLQANPDAARVQDMLSMAQYKQSKAIMYALANTVKKYYKGEVTTVLKDVAKFIKSLLNDCLREGHEADEMTFLILRVVGVMGPALQAASPSLISSILQCVKKTDIPLSNQKAAIHAFRLMDITNEASNVLLEVFRDAKSPVEKRIAAYLILMKNSERSPVRDILKSLQRTSDKQLKSFVVSHLMNVHKSDQKIKEQFGQDIILALRDQPPSNDKSQNFRADYSFGSIQSDVIFDDMNILPKEVTLKTTLNVFDGNFDMFEVGVEGSGFEPKIAALFGKNGLFPDSASTFFYWAGEKAPFLRGFLERIGPGAGNTKTQVPRDFLKDLMKSVQKFLRGLQSSPAPEIIAFLRLLGNEVGYMKASELRQTVETLFMHYHALIPSLTAQAFFALTSSTENDVFAHYIFMEKAFSIATAAGFPLQCSFSGLLSPGAKGGLKYSFSDADLTFLPSVGLEFITQMGVYVPDYVEARLQMHTNMYHESSLNVKITTKKNQIRLSISAPRSSTQLLSVSHRVLLVSSSQTTTVPSIEECVESSECQPLFSGLRFCTVVCHSNFTAMENVPFYPLTGKSRFAFEVQPSGNVSEYTATITDERTKETRKDIFRVKTLTLKAEGDYSKEARVSLKYSQSKKVFVAEVLIPHYDVEAGMKITVTDSDSNVNGMFGTSIDVTNRNSPVMNLIAQTRFGKDTMLHLQTVFPCLKSNASFTANLRTDEDMLMDVKTIISLPETHYQQKVSFKYDSDKLEMQLKSDLRSGIKKLMPNVESHRRRLQDLMDQVLDQQVTMTDMKYRHIVSKGIEAANIWLNKLIVRVPVLANLRRKRSISDLTLPALPENLFLQWNSFFRYQFNKDKMTILFYLPLGGQKSEDLNVPLTLSIPLNGLYGPDIKYQLPPFTIPPFLLLNLPLFGLAEAHAKISSNLYDWETSLYLGNKTVDVPTYIAEFKTMGHSPVKALSYKFQGTGQMSGRADDDLKYQLDGFFSHSLFDTSFSLSQMSRVTDKLRTSVDYSIKASSLAGLQASAYYTARSESTLHSDDVSGDGTLEASFQLGSSHINSSYAHSYKLRPVEQEGRGECTLSLRSSLIQIHNHIHAVYVNSELNIVSKTSSNDGFLAQTVELRYKDAELTLRSNAAARVVSIPLNNRVELAVSTHAASLTVESQAENDKKRLYFILTGTVDSNWLKIMTEGALMLGAGCRGLHKASVMANRTDLSTNVTNSIQCNPVTVEVVLSGDTGSSEVTLEFTTTAVTAVSRGECTIRGQITPQEASLYGVLTGQAYDATTRNDMNILLNRRTLIFSSNTMGAMKEITTEHSHSLALTLWTLTLRSQTKNFIQRDIYYEQTAKVDAKPFLLSFALKNDLKIHDVILSHDGRMKLEPLKVDLRGSTKGANGRGHSITHVYNLNYENNYGTVKYRLAGTAMNAQLHHKCHLAFAGFASAANCKTQIDSEFLHFDGAVCAVAVPFRVLVDAFVRGDAGMNLQGNHTGQLDSKLLFKAEPFTLAYAHESRLKTLHVLQSGDISSHINHTFDGLLTPTEQLLTWEVNSKLNNAAYSQDASIYNNPMKSGFNFSYLLMTDVLNKYIKNNFSHRGNEEISLALGLTYEKSRTCRVVESPSFRSFPCNLKQLKDTIVQALEYLKHSTNKLNIGQIIVDLQVKLKQLPMQVRHFIQESFSEQKMNRVKAKLDSLMKDFTVTMDDLEIGMSKFWKMLENTLIDMSKKHEAFTVAVKDYFRSDRFTDEVTAVISQVGRQLQAFEMKYKIKELLIKVLDAVQAFFKQVEIRAEWFQKPHLKFNISETVKTKMLEIKQIIRDTDIILLVQDVKDYLLSVEWATYVDQLSYQTSYSQISERIETMSEVILNWIDEYEIPSKLNAIYLYIKDLLLKYNIGDSLKEKMDQMVILIKDLKLEESVQLIVDALNAINVNLVYEKMLQSLHHIIMQVKSTDFQRSLDDLNQYVSFVLKSVKEFDYRAFVDGTNDNIVSLTNHINEQFKKFYIVQKIEAVRVFFREIKISLYSFLDELRRTKISDALRKLEKVIETTVFNDIRMKAKDILEDVRQRISDMDIREEVYFYLQRASTSYTNTLAFISLQFNELLERIQHLAKNIKFISQMKESAGKALGGLTRAEIKVPTFVVPFTDLVIPEITITLNKLHELQLPAEISVPEFTILNSYTIPGFTINFNQVKERIVVMIDALRKLEIQMPDPEIIFGDIKVLYLFQLPDLTFSEISLSEIKLPAINIPILNLTDFQTEMPPMPDIEFPKFSSNICIPVSGKLEGEFQVNIPQYTLATMGKIENFTSALSNQQFTAIVTSEATSPFGFLEHSFEATARLEAPNMQSLLFTETMKATHTTLSVEHKGSLTVTQGSAGVSSHTWTKVTTQMFQSDVVHHVAFTLENALSAAINTSCDYGLFIAAAETSSLGSVKQNLAATVTADQVTVTSETTGVGKWAVGDYNDEGKHTHDLKFNIHFQSTEFDFVEKPILKLNQTKTAQSTVVQHVSLRVKCQTEIPSVIRSTVVLNGEAHPASSQAFLMVSHGTDFTGNVIGSMQNMVEVSVTQFEIVFSAENRVNTKILLPLKLTGKMDLQQDYRLLLTSERQCANWFTLARFNQYNYKTNVTAENNEMELYVHVTASGEANLGFLTVPLSVPNINIPYLKIETPQVQGLSLWDYAGFKNLLTTPQQKFQTNRRIVFSKNLDNFTIYLQPI